MTEVTGCTVWFRLQITGVNRLKFIAAAILGWTNIRLKNVTVKFHQDGKHGQV